MSNENFIKVLKCMFDSSDKRLDSQSLSVYGHLYRSRQSEKGFDSLVTNLELISSSLRFKLRGRARDKIKQLRDSIILLCSKGYLKSSINSETKKNDIVEISFDTEIIKNERFAKLKYIYFDYFKSCDEFYVYCFILSGEQYGKKISYRELSNKVGVSSEKIRLIVNKLNTASSKPRIYKFSGSYGDGSRKQEENVYYAVLDSEKKKIWNSFYDENGDAKMKRRKGTRKNTDLVFCVYSGEITVAELKKRVMKSQWKTGSARTVEYEDYELFKICERERIDIKFIENCKIRMDDFRASVDYDGRFDEYEKEYRRDMIGLGVEIDMGEL